MTHTACGTNQLSFEFILVFVFSYLDQVLLYHLTMYV